MHSPARITTRLLAALMAVSGVALALAGCSTGTGSGDYPAVLATPTARSDQTMTPDEVKQATDALISERNRLSGGSSTQQRTQASAPASTSKATNAGDRSSKRRMQATAPASTTSAENAGNAQ